MLKKTFLALLLAPLLFTAACNKTDDTPASEFVINGVHDVDMGGSAGSNVLSLSVVQTSGSQERVTLSVTGLPAGVTATIDPASGTPAFSASITFSQSGFITAKTYPIKIVGTSASYTKSYDLNITIPAMKGWILGSTTYRQSSMTHSSFSGYGFVSVNSLDNGGAVLTASLIGLLPTADGTYTYKLVEVPTGSDEMGLATFGGGDFSFTGNDHHTGTITLAGGKCSLNIPATEVSDGSVTKMVTVMASE